MWSRRRNGRCSLEKVLEHGGRVGRSGLLAFDGGPKVLDSAAALPDLLKLAGEDLRSTFSREPGLLQTQLAHLHVVLTWIQQKIKGTTLCLGAHLPSADKSHIFQ